MKVTRASTAATIQGRNLARVFNRSSTISQIIPAPAGRNLREIGNLIYEQGAAIPYRLYYAAFPPPYSETGQVEIWMATSVDGATWVNGTAPIITSRYLEDPYVFKTPQGWELYAKDKTAQPQKLMRAFRSADGLTGWTDLGALGIPVGGAGSYNAVDVSSPIAWLDGTRRYCLYEGRTNGQAGAIGLAYTDNADPAQPWVVMNGGLPVATGNNPTFYGNGAVPTVRWSSILVPDDLLRVGNAYMMLCHGYTASNRFVPILLTSTDLINWHDVNGHELFNPDSINAPSETWMFGDPDGSTIYFTDSSQANPGGIKLATTRSEALRRVSLQWQPGGSSQRLYLPPGPQAILSIRIDGSGTFGRARFKDSGDGDGGFVSFGAPTFDSNAFPLYIDVPSTGPGRVLDLQATPLPGSQLYAQLLMFDTTQGGSGSAVLGAAPAQQTNINVTDGSGQSTISWTPGAGYVSQAITVNGVTTQLSAAAANYTITGLVNGTITPVFLTASNAYGTSLPTVVVNAAPTAEPRPTPPAAPVITVTPGDNRVTVGIAPAPVGVTAVNTSRSPAYPAGSIPNLTPSTTSFTDSTAVNGRTYTYTVSFTNSGGTTPSAAVSGTPQAVTVLSTTPVWANILQPNRLVVNVMNDSSVVVSDHLITVPLPAGATPTNTDLRVYEYGARGSLDRGNERRYGGLDYNRFGFGVPCWVENGQVTFKALGRFDIGESRRWAFMWGNATAVVKDYAHLNLVNTTATDYQIGRTGPDTENLANSLIGLPLAGNTYGQGRVTFGAGTTVLRLPVYNVLGDGATYGIIAGTATVTQRNAELGIQGTLTGQIRAGQSLPDWSGTYTAKYQHRALGSTRNDNGGGALKGFDVLRVSLTLTCGVSYAPANNGQMKLLELYNGSNNTTNGAIGMWQRPDGGPITAAPAGTAVPFAGTVTAGLVGGTGSVISSGLRLRALSLPNWGAAAPASFGWGAFGAQAVTVSTSPLSSANPVPVGAQINFDFDLVINSTLVVQANALAAELANVLDALGVTL